MKEKQLTNEESLSLITEMIGQAKKNLAKGGSFYFLLWGWVVMFANLGHYIIAEFTDYANPQFVWLITFPAAIASMIYGFKQGRNAKTVSHLDRVYGYLWIAVFVAVILLISFIPNVHLFINPIVLIFAGLGTMISGFLLRFRPLVIGGLALWASALIASQLDVNLHYLMGAIGIFVGYIVPGYLLKRAENA